MAGWQDALMTLHGRGWDAEDIDAAAEAVCEACADGAFEGMEVLELQHEDVEAILDDEYPEEEVGALLELADLRAREDSESIALSRALYDLDAFAYEYEQEEG